MNVAVRYYSRAGSTEKVAKAIARELRVKAETVDVPLPKEVDVLFVGSGIYAGHIDKHVKTFLEGLTPQQVKKVAFFGTSMLSGSGMDKEVAGILAKKNIRMDTRTYHCHGKFLFFHKDSPTEKELLDAEIFAKKIGKK